MPWRKRKYDGDGDEDAPAKKEKPTWTTPLKKSDPDSGDTYWELSSRKRLTISEWKGQLLLSAREYYPKDGKMLPGKGISLTQEQVGALILALPEALETLKGKGMELPESGNADENEDDDDEEKRKDEKDNENVKRDEHENTYEVAGSDDTK